MLKRTHKVALMAVLTVVMVLAFAGVALAQWTDMNLSIVGPYGITEAQVGQISQGFVDGSWGPYNQMPRKQFVKMAVDAYKIPLYSPATPTYTDVPATDDYYAYVEGATKAGLTNGVGGGKFEPNSTITREQAAAIIVRWVAAKNGYNLDTYYTDAEATAILSAFPDAAQVGPSLIKEMAFAVDFDIIWGTATGTLAPKGTLVRIQGAAMLIRSWGIVPFTPPVTPPAAIALVGDDKSENLIGLAHTVTFKVTDAAGAPVANALVDFDTLMAGYYYVGNIAPKAGLTDAAGEVKCVLLSTEPGTERVSASVMTPAGPKTQLVTKYWVVLDEVYILDDTREAQNNVGDPHVWEARVVVFGPGPLSTSAQDWYNAVSLTADPTKPAMELDGVDWPLGWAIALLNQAYQYLLPVPGSDDWADFFDQSDDMIDAWIDAHEELLASDPDLATLINSFLAVDRWSMDTEDLMLAHGYAPRTMAGVPVTWTITNDDAVGYITAVEHSGTIAADKQSAVGFTDAEGESAVTIDSTTTGETDVQAVADYAGNPYPEKLFNHLTSNLQLHFLDWDDQPLPQATAEKTWIPHVIGDDTSPISPALTYANLGEEVLLTITLKDSYGNPVADRQVEWFMQGIGFFVTDDGNEITDPQDPAGNKDIDTTNDAGQAFVLVKSYDAGEQIVHAKVRDKGTGGNEGSFITYDAEVQWFDVDVATFDDPKTDELAVPVEVQTDGIADWQETGFYPESWAAYDLSEDELVPWDTNEALASNNVGDDHTFTVHVYGLKLELDPNVDNADQQTPLIDTDYKGAAYDGIIDWRDAAYFGADAVLFVNCNQDPDEIPGYIDGDMPFDYNGNGVIDDHANERGTATFEVQGREVTLTGVGGVTRFDWNDDGYKEAFDGMTGIYLPLEGKDVSFEVANETDEDTSNLGSWFDGIDVDAVGDLTPETAVTDAAGEAQVTVSSEDKGPETVQATIDWDGNPHEGSELVQAYAKKLWIAETNLHIVVTEDGVEIADSDNSPAQAAADVQTVPWYTTDGDLNYTHYEVHVYDQYGNDLPDYEVVYLLSDLGEYQYGNQGAGDTYRPIAFLEDEDPDDYLDEDNPDNAYDLNGDAPDADEPMPESDPYAEIVGDGGTPAFFFNQWLMAGPDGSNKNVYAGEGVYFNEDLFFDQPGYVQWPGQRINGGGFDDYVDNEDIGLVTDGAKAWTLDGYFAPDWADGDIVPNLKPGSSIDVELAEQFLDAEGGPVVPEADEYLTILHILVYAPADGLVVNDEPSLVWSYQIHQLWENPVVTTVTLEPDEQMAVAGLDSVTLTATVLDQFDRPMEGVDVTFAADDTDAVLTNDPDVGPLVTDVDGQVNVTWDEVQGDYGDQYVTATADLVDSNEAEVIWAYYDIDNTYVSAAPGSDRVIVFGGTDFGAIWDGQTATAYLNPDDDAIGDGVYDVDVDLSIDTSHTFSPTIAEPFYVNFDGDNGVDAPDWVYALTGVL